MGYLKTEFVQRVQEYIDNNGIDKNSDGKISKADGELQALLSGIGAKNEKSLLKKYAKRKDYLSGAICLITTSILSGAVLLEAKYTKFPIRKWMDTLVNKDGHSAKEAKRLIKKCIAQSHSDSKEVAISLFGIGCAGVAYSIFKKAE